MVQESRIDHKFSTAELVYILSEINMCLIFNENEKENSCSLPYITEVEGILLQYFWKCYAILLE